MKKAKFQHPMTKVEAIVGWVYVFVHIFAMPYIVSALNAFVFPKLGFQLNSTWLNFLYYAIGFVFLMGFLFHFLRESFGNMWNNFMATVVSVLIGYVAYIFLSAAVNLMIGFFVPSTVNPNSAAINSIIRINPKKMVVIGVLLAPVVEETLFRGVVFGTLRRKNAILAYVVSSLLFSVYHLWSYFLDGGSLWDLLYLLQYIPAGLVLGWCYEHSGSVWASVFLHMLINYVSITVTVG